VFQRTKKTQILRVLAEAMGYKLRLPKKKKLILKPKKANKTLTRSHSKTYPMNLMAGTIVYDTDSSALYLSVTIDMSQIQEVAKIFNYLQTHTSCWRYDFSKFRSSNTLKWLIQ
jgi:hypothetical protein